ncbi:MAG: hypothetical protein J7L76_06405 [Spirochaetaceae bacterium]|nr:hypothetical protein [Spirochaetaceae bacterium]RKX70238.1 MAG: hypothetical protein DRP60_15895 [Spirochaetota bacterium]RKX78476.1 MAG: hypothetical protein DRP49_00710 [Spirochaetota bacterium]RKX90261.1 MAG: hypothetical protein DRP70_01260 [Spirochaetota bacterium]RKX97551.1 MAG: hypothetical protein DRZ90_05920 [Spirochaetota bacterium]
MAKRIDIDKAGLVEIVGKGLILNLTTDDQDRILIRAESEAGGYRIKIKVHEDDPGVITYALGEVIGGPQLSIVK